MHTKTIILKYIWSLSVLLLSLLLLLFLFLFLIFFNQVCSFGMLLSTTIYYKLKRVSLDNKFFHCE
jgi:hypothetical protein